MINYYIHKSRSIVEQYGKWLSEDYDSAKERLTKLLESKDSKLKKMVYRMIEKRYGSEEEPIFVIIEDEPIFVIVEDGEY